ncbi:TPA: YgjV family protein [Photobacterium damselae]
MVDIFSEPFSTAQAFGFFSFILGLSTFYQKDDCRLKIVMLILNINHLIHYLLLGSNISAMSSLLSALRTSVAIYFTPARISSRRATALFILIGICFGINFTDSGWELWPIFGSVIGTYAVFMLQGILMRIAFLIGATCWLINNILVGSIGGTLLELSVIVTNIITIIRLIREPKDHLVISSN